MDMKRKSRDAILQLVELEREGEQIDRTLLKNVLSIFIEVGMGTMSCYQQDFEATLLKTTAEYYKRKAAFWIEEDSCPDYMVRSNIMWKSALLRLQCPILHCHCRTVFKGFLMGSYTVDHPALDKPRNALCGTQAGAWHVTHCFAAAMVSICTGA